MKKFVVFATIFLSSTAFAEKYSGINSPTHFNRLMGTSTVLQLNDLPTSGHLFDMRYGWSETYWPSNVGGISYRWNHPNPEPFSYRMHTKEELLKMSQSQLAQLSPSELYDIAMGDYNYNLTKNTMRRFSVRNLWWEGICHGWAQAAANYPEPAPVVIKNKDGIKVPFGSSDVKGLLAMHNAYNNTSGGFAFVGKRCSAKGKVTGEGDERDANPNPPSIEESNAPDCRDVNAGSFHLVLSNMLGIHGRSFVADIDRYNDVWNQPITAYTSSVLGEEEVTADHQYEGIVRRVRIQTKMTYGEELKFYTKELAAQGKKNFVSKLPVTGTEHQEFRSKTYEYIVELDARGNIVGGEWISETRPDFLWGKKRETRFVNSPIPLAGLNTIYRPVKR